jgi:hypothetical protein
LLYGAKPLVESDPELSCGSYYTRIDNRLLARACPENSPLFGSLVHLKMTLRGCCATIGQEERRAFEVL